MKITMLAAALASAALSVGANADVLYSNTYDGTYTSLTNNTTLSSFTPTAGNKYGISATINASPFTATNIDQTANQTYFGFSGSFYDFPNNPGVTPNYGALGLNVNVYAWGGQWLFVNPITWGKGTGTPTNLQIGDTSVANPYGPLNVGVLLDTTQATWTLSYYYGGTGFNDTAVYQGGSLIGTTTNLDPSKVRSGIYFTYDPTVASGGEAQSIVSGFKVVDAAIPKPLTITSNTPGTFTLSWRGRSGCNYFIQRSDDLAGGWVYLTSTASGSSIPIMETGSNAVIWRVISESAPKAFYRLQLDTDQNGLPDSWELAYTGTTGNNPSALSPAGDGYTLLQKFQRGLNPNDYYQAGAGGTAYYVDGINGSDSYTNVQAQKLSTPWKTIQKAASNMVAGDTCLIRAGTYRETVTVPNSGTAGAPMTFKSYNNETVIISGAQPLPGAAGWIAYPDLTNVFYTTAMNWDFGVGNNQIFVNGVMTPEAQWPNPSQESKVFPWRDSSLKPSKDWSYVETCGYDANGQNGWFTDAGLPNRADDYWNGTRLMILSGYGWWYSSYPTITNYNAADKKLTSTHAVEDPAYDLTAGNEFYLVGKKEEMDTPGEWYYEAATSRLYIYSAAGAPSGVEAKKRNVGFDLSGRSNIALSGLSFFAATVLTDGTSANCDLDGLRMTYPSYRETGNDCGLTLQGSGHVLRNSELAFSSGYLLSLTGSDIKVVNNWLHDAGFQPAYCAIVNGSGFRNLIRHNTMNAAGRAGFCGTYPGGIIEYNDIYDTMRLTSDGGALYVNGEGPTLFRYNLVHDAQGATGHVGHGAQGFYADSTNSNWILHHNIIWNNADWAMQFNNPQNFNMVFNNTTLGSAGSVLAGFPAPANTGSRMFNNLFSGTPTGLGDTDLLTNLYTDPGYQNASGSDFRLVSNSPAIDAGSIIPGVTDGYLGGAPDIGALEYGAADWTVTARHNFANPVTKDACAYVWPDMVFANRIPDNTSFENGLTHWTLAPGSNAALCGPYWSWLDGRTRTGSWSVQFSAGVSELSRTVTGLLPNRVYRFYCGVTGENGSILGANVRIGVRDQDYQPSSAAATLGDRNAPPRPIFTASVWNMNYVTFLTGTTGSATIYVSVNNPTSDLVYIDDLAVLLEKVYEAPSVDMTLYLPLSEAFGSATPDRSGNGRTGTLVNMDNINWTPATPASVGNALQFDGTCYVQVTDSPAMNIGANNADFTVAFWVKLNAGFTGQWRVLMQKGSDASQQRTPGLWMSPSDNRIQYCVTDSANWNDGGFSTAQLTVSQWTHVAMIKTSGTLQLYLNGSLDSSYPLQGTVSSNNSPLYIGKSPDYDGVQCAMNEVRIYNRALSPTEIGVLSKSPGGKRIFFR